MKPWLHAQNSAKKFGGKPEDFIDLHEWFDQSKSSLADMRHRAVLHHSLGCYIAAQVFGDENGNMELSDGRLIPVRDVAEQHIIEDMGRIPSVQDYLQGMPLYDWLGGLRKSTKTIKIVD